MRRFPDVETIEKAGRWKGERGALVESR